jgi:hypothetical protein
MPYPSTYEAVPRGVRAIAVGWLDPPHSYAVGTVDQRFLERLFEACLEATTVVLGEESVAVGDGGIRVVASDGTWLVAPTLILHYVTEHAYEPPPEFIAALTGADSRPHESARVERASLGPVFANVTRAVRSTRPRLMNRRITIQT